jgi:hypothetical protein
MVFKRAASEDIFDRLEREANNDFILLDEFGPAHFSQEHLLEMRQKTLEYLDQFQRRQKWAMTFGAVASIWIFLAFLSMAFGYAWPALFAYIAGFGCFSAFLFLIFRQKKQFGSKGELEYAKRVIEDELRLRVGKMPQK